MRSFEADLAGRFVAGILWERRGKVYKILIVDDDQALTRALTVRLRAAGFHVDVSNSAYDATRVAPHARPDLIILDVDMPGYTGLEFHQCLQFTQRSRHIPVIYLSGHDTELNRRLAFEQGAATFLTKPYDADHLVTAIHSAIEASPNPA